MGRASIISAVLAVAALVIANNAAAFPGEQSKYCGLGFGFQIGSADGLSTQHAGFLGVFDGKWGRKLPHTLIVYDIKPDGRAKGYYAWGIYTDWKIDRPGCQYWTGAIREDELTFALNNGAKVTYVLDGDRLHGAYSLNDNVTLGTFRRFGATRPSTANDLAPFPGELPKYCDLAPSLQIGSTDGLSAQQAGYLGVFDGRWRLSLPHTLIVHSVQADGRAKGYYAWGAYGAWNIHEPGCVYWTGNIQQGELTFMLRNGAKVTYVLDRGTLYGVYWLDENVTLGAFQKVAP